MSSVTIYLQTLSTAARAATILIFLRIALQLGYVYHRALAVFRVWDWEGVPIGFARGRLPRGWGRVDWWWCCVLIILHA